MFMLKYRSKVRFYDRICFYLYVFHAEYHFEQPVPGSINEVAKRLTPGVRSLEAL